MFRLVLPVLAALSLAPPVKAAEIERCRAIIETLVPPTTQTPKTKLSVISGKPGAGVSQDHGKTQVVYQVGGQRFQALPENPEEAAALLYRMDAVARVLERIGKRGASQHALDSALPYEDRQTLLHTDPTLQTVEAYTLGTLPKNEADLKHFLRDPHNWVAARWDIIKKIREEYAQAVSQLSAHLTKGKKVLFLMRGNSGSGKSYTLKHGKHPALEAAQISSIPPALEMGIINPDALKTKLQNEMENGKVSTDQVHEEGSMIADLLIQSAMDRGESLIVDKRFGRRKQVEAITARAKGLGYHVVVIDVDAPLDASAHRVSERIPGGSSPNVPFAPIAQGFKEARTERSGIAELPTVDDYLLFSSSKEHSGLIASRTGSQPIHVEEGREKAWNTLTTAPSDQEIAAARLRRGDVLNTLSHFPPDARQALETGKAPAYLATHCLECQATRSQERPHFYISPQDIRYWKPSAEKSLPFPKITRLPDMHGLCFEMKLGFFGRSAKYRIVQIEDDQVRLENLQTGKQVALPSNAFAGMKKTVLVDTEYVRWVTETVEQAALSMIRGLRYRVPHDNGTLKEHRSYADALSYYFQHTIPGIDIRTTETDRTYWKSASIRMELRNVDSAMRNRLLHDRYYQVELHNDEAGEPMLVLDTHKFDPTPHKVFVGNNWDEFNFWDERRNDTRDNGPGYNDPDYESPGSRGREFVNYAYRLDVDNEIRGSVSRLHFPGAPLAFEFLPNRGGWHFDRNADYTQYGHAGFWAHEPSAASFSARVELRQAKKLLDSNLLSGSAQEREQALDFALTAEKNLQTAQTLSNIAFGLTKEAAENPSTIDSLYNGIARIKVPEAQLARRQGKETRDQALLRQLELASGFYQNLQSEQQSLEKEIQQILYVLEAPKRLRSLE